MTYPSFQSLFQFTNKLPSCFSNWFFFFRATPGLHSHQRRFSQCLAISTRLFSLLRRAASIPPCSKRHNLTSSDLSLPVPSSTCFDNVPLFDQKSTITTNALYSSAQRTLSTTSTALVSFHSFTRSPLLPPCVSLTSTSFFSASFLSLAPLADVKPTDSSLFLLALLSSSSHFRMPFAQQNGASTLTHLFPDNESAPPASFFSPSQTLSSASHQPSSSKTQQTVLSSS